jgi:hypothetical protein
MPQEGWPLFWNLVAIFGTAFGASSVFILALFLGFCIILGFPKLRSTLGHKSMVIAICGLTRHVVPSMF